MFGKILGSGAGSDVYEYGADKVCKLFVDKYGIDVAEREYKKTLDARNNGLPAPKVYEIIEHNGRHGIVMERIQGETFRDIVLNHIMRGYGKGRSIEEIFNSQVILELIKDTARILNDLHQKNCDLMVTAKMSLIKTCDDNNYLDQDEKLVIYSLIEALPDDDSVCHGDPNVGNFIYHEGNIHIVDWANCVKGHPFFDIAKYITMNKYPNISSSMPYKDVLYFAESSNKVFLDEYGRLSKMDLSGVQSWIIPILVSKMQSNNREERQMRLLNGIRDGLRRL